MAEPVGPEDGVAWVTGASSGIGRQVALLLAGLGWRVAATARSTGELDELAAEASDLKGRIHPVQADISDPDAVEAAVRHIEGNVGPVALVIPNAGIYEPVDARELDASAFTKTFGVNVVGTAHCLAHVLPGMKARGRGQIAIVASVTGYGGLPTSAAYGASKAALINLAETLRIELEPLGILVQVVNPGFIDTPATKDNPFPMPALMSAANAARRLVRGLRSTAFEITFPRRFTYVLKALSFLPVPWRLALVRRVTGWSDPEKSAPMPQTDAA